jgi:hypothetical protein
MQALQEKTKQTKSRSILEMGKDKKYDVKRSENIAISGMPGTYYGEHSKVNGKPEGSGLFVFYHVIILGSFENGKLSRCLWFVELNK